MNRNYINEIIRFNDLYYYHIIICNGKCMIEYKPEELLSVKPAIIGVASGIVIKEGAITVRFSSCFRLGVAFALYQ